MSKSVKIPVTHKCKNGEQGNIVSDAGAFSCLGCGKEWVSSFELKDFFQLYREEISKDLQEHDSEWMAQNWGFSNQRSGQLRRSFNLIDSARPPKKPIPSGSGAPGPYGLPAWNDNWPFAVQLKWLDLFHYYKMKEDGEIKE